MTERQKDPSQGLNGAVAAVLNGERVAAGLTMEQLGERVGLAKRTVIRLLSTMERDIDVDVLGRMADEFCMTPVEVVEAAIARMDRPARPSDIAARRARKPASTVKKAARKDRAPGA